MQKAGSFIFKNEKNKNYGCKTEI